jgi:hypothetical protein
MKNRKQLKHKLRMALFTMVTRVRQRKRLNMRRKNLKSLLLQRRLLMEILKLKMKRMQW